MDKASVLGLMGQPMKESGKDYKHGKVNTLTLIIIREKKLILMELSLSQLGSMEGFMELAM